MHSPIATYAKRARAISRRASGEDFSSAYASEISVEKFPLSQFVKLLKSTSNRFMDEFDEFVDEFAKLHEIW